MKGDTNYRFAWMTAIVVLAALLIYRGLVIFSYNGELAGIDNNFVYDVCRSIGGYSIYSDPSSPPYAVTLYSPLYFSICGSIGQLFNINPDDPIHVYQLCRSVSLVCDIITCLLLYKVVTRLGAGRELSLLATSCFACIICLLGYTFSRSDSLLLTFYAASIYVLVSANTIPRILLLALLSTGCILSKQNGIIVPVVISAWLLIHRKNKLVLIYLLSYLLITATALFAYRAAFPGIFLNTVSALNNRIDLSWFYTDIFKRAMNSLWVLPLYLAIVVAIRNWRKGKDRAWAAIFIIQFLFGLATSLKWGSTAGYFNESFFLAFIILLLSIDPASGFVKKTVLVFLPLLLLFTFHIIAEGYLFFLQNKQGKSTLYQHQKEVRDYLEPKLKDRYVLNLADPNKTFYKTLFYKNIAVPNMDMVDCCLLPDQTFNYSSLKQDLMNGKISHLVTDGEKPDEIWGFSLESFVQDTSLNGYTIYRHPLY